MPLNTFNNKAPFKVNFEKFFVRDRESLRFELQFFFFVFARPSRSHLFSLPLFSPSFSFSQARVKSVERIVGPKATGETMHIIIETEGKIPFWEGQSYGVIPPGEFWFFILLFLSLALASFSFSARSALLLRLPVSFHLCWALDREVKETPRNSPFSPLLFPSL